MRNLLTLLSFVLGIVSHAQVPPTTLGGWTDKLQRQARVLPQEAVERTSRTRPSNRLSGPVTGSSMPHYYHFDPYVYGASDGIPDIDQLQLKVGQNFTLR